MGAYGMTLISPTAYLPPMSCTNLIGSDGLKSWDLLAVESPFEYTGYPWLERQSLAKEHAEQREQSARCLVSLAHRSLLTERHLRAFTEIDREPGHGDERITSLLGFSLKYFTRPWEKWLSWREQLSIMFENTECPVVLFSGGLLRYSMCDYTHSLEYSDGIDAIDLENEKNDHTKTHAVLSGCVGDRAGFVFEHLAGEAKRPIILIDPQSAMRDIQSGRGQLDLQAYYQVMATYPVKTRSRVFRSVLAVKIPRAS